MEKNKCLECVVAIVAEIFERDAASLNAGTRLMQDLPCESIDLLEIAARISREARREVDDDALFLRNVRTLVYEHPDDSAENVLAGHFPWIDGKRRVLIAQEIESPAPFVTLGDMAMYLEYVLSR